MSIHCQQSCIAHAIEIRFLGSASTELVLHGLTSQGDSVLAWQIDLPHLHPTVLRFRRRQKIVDGSHRERCDSSCPQWPIRCSSKAYVVASAQIALPSSEASDRVGRSRSPIELTFRPPFVLARLP